MQGWRELCSADSTKDTRVGGQVLCESVEMLRVGGDEERLLARELLSRHKNHAPAEATARALVGERHRQAKIVSGLQVIEHDPRRWLHLRKDVVHRIGLAVRPAHAEPPAATRAEIELVKL